MKGVDGGCRQSGSGDLTEGCDAGQAGRLERERERAALGGAMGGRQGRGCLVWGPGPGRTPKPGLGPEEGRGAQPEACQDRSRRGRPRGPADTHGNPRSASDKDEARLPPLGRREVGVGRLHSPAGRRLPLLRSRALTTLAGSGSERLSEGERRPCTKGTSAVKGSGVWAWLSRLVRIVGGACRVARSGPVPAERWPERK